MKRLIEKVISFTLVLLLILSLASCTIVVKKPGQGNENGNTGTGGGSVSDGTDDGTDGGDGEENEGGGSSDVITDGEEDGAQDGLQGESLGFISARAFLGETLLLSEDAATLLGEGDISWSTECEGIATVEDGCVTPVKCGRTNITAKNAEDKSVTFRVTVEFKVYADGGYNIVSDVVDETVYKVTSAYEANRLLDRAIIEHKHKVTIDFSGISEDFTVDDFELDSELGSHAHFKTTYYPSKPHIVYVEVIYNSDAASVTTAVTDENASYYVANGNSLVRKYFDKGETRAADFEGFKINSITETLDVYNSEELWWAIEHGYRPTFPGEYSKAELFYERAKMILREIVNDSMTDYEKLVSIYEYLIENVNYDYDSYYSEVGKNNTCYYLEGVFESGLAVCDGKTKALVLFLGIEGIGVLRDFGSSKTGGAGHAWNYVEIDGEWYLVDTTEGDSRFSLSTGGGISAFYESSIETVSYGSLLLSLDSHSDKYIYGEIWQSVFDEESGAYPDASDAYFDHDVTEGFDFILSSGEETAALVAAVRETLEGSTEEFILTVIMEDEDASIHAYLRAAELDGIKTAIFTVDYDGQKVYLVLFKEEAVAA